MCADCLHMPPVHDNDLVSMADRRYPLRNDDLCHIRQFFCKPASYLRLRRGVHRACGVI